MNTHTPTSMDTVFQHVAKCYIHWVTCSQKITQQVIQECSQRSLNKTMQTWNTQHERIPTYPHTHMCTCTNTYTYTCTHHILTCTQILFQAQGHCGMLYFTDSVSPPSSNFALSALHIESTRPSTVHLTSHVLQLKETEQHGHGGWWS